MTAALVAAIGCATPEPAVEGTPWIGTDAEGHVVASAVLPDGRSLRVMRGDGAPIAGRTTWSDGVLTFRSASPAGRAATYRASSAAGAAVLHTPAVVAEPVEVSFLGPDVLPCNALKLYVDFSAPVRPDPVLLSRVALVDLTTGEEVARPAFHEIPLWSPDGTRLTLLFHPGRQKTDIGFAAGLGPVLREGHRYRVVLGRGLVSVDGAAIPPAGFVFTAGPRDAVPPDPARWTVSYGGDGLVVTLDGPLEPVLAARAFRLVGPEGPVGARFWLDGSRLFVRPEGPIPAGARLEQVEPVEDLAGNVPGRRFDGPATDRVEVAPWSVALGGVPSG